MSVNIVTLSTEDFWAGDFGTQYIERNRFDWQKRVPFWTSIVARIEARYETPSIMEFGCNIGSNLMALRTVRPTLTLRGVDVNMAAVDQAHNLGFDVYGNEVTLGSIKTYHNSSEAFDLCFTAGVLIHISPEDIADAMTRIKDYSRRYILAIEYFAEQEEEVEYRGHAGKLWKRNYGKLYEDLGLKLVEKGFVGKEDGFDDCVWWLLERP